jgi:hypothetical protein
MGMIEGGSSSTFLQASSFNCFLNQLWIIFLQLPVGAMLHIHQPMTARFQIDHKAFPVSMAPNVPTWYGLQFTAQKRQHKTCHHYKWVIYASRIMMVGRPCFNTVHGCTTLSTQETMRSLSFHAIFWKNRILKQDSFKSHFLVEPHGCIWIEAACQSYHLN